MTRKGSRQVIIQSPPKEAFTRSQWVGDYIILISKYFMPMALEEVTMAQHV
jgi:hypothetical protein